MLVRVPVQHWVTSGKETPMGATPMSVGLTVSMEFVATVAWEIAAFISQNSFPADNLVADKTIAGPVDELSCSFLILLFHVRHSLTKP